MRLILLLIITLISVSACSKKIKEKIGVTTTGPDEYRVLRSKSLEVPPHYDLPVPGTPSDVSSSIHDNNSSLNEGEKALIKEMGQ